MLNLILFGAPGAGKGTQANFLTKAYNLVHLSTGDLLRSQIESKTELGIEAKTYIDKGFLVPDSIVIAMIHSKLSKIRTTKGFIFDGFPRTVEQAKSLDNLLVKHGKSISGMLCLEVDKDELINRLLIRGVTSGRSDDQGVEVIKNRIEVYIEKTMPLINYYKEQNKYHRIDGMGSIEDITLRLQQAIESI
jgi:adenylate kinase